MCAQGRMSFNILIHFAKALRDLEGRPEEEEQFKKILSSLEAKRISKQKKYPFIWVPGPQE